MTPGDPEDSGNPAIPEGAMRLLAGSFAGPPERLLTEEGRSLLCARLLEDGDQADLRWLLGSLGAEAVAAWFAEHGGRLLSPRSCAFWSLVLDQESGPSSPVASALWPA